MQAKGSTYAKYKNPLQAVLGWERFKCLADGLHLRQNGTEQKKVVIFLGPPRWLTFKKRLTAIMKKKGVIVFDVMAFET